MAFEGLGRSYNVVPIASGAGISLRQCSGITFIGTSAGAAATFTFTLATSFGGAYSQPTGWNPFTKYYRSTSQAGTAAWTKQTQAASNVVTDATLNASFAIELLGPMVPDTFAYVKCTATGAGALVAAILHDLEVQRRPENLKIPGAQ